VRARTTQCQSNLRQIATALNLYADDNRSRYPSAGGTISFDPRYPTATGPRSWIEQLGPYTSGDYTIFTCADSAGAITGNDPWSYFLGAHAAMVASGGAFGPVLPARISLPARHIIAGDATFPFSADDADKDDYTQNAAFHANPAPMHRGLLNIAFADGHVESLRQFDPQRHAIRYEGLGFSYP
jgi:prepilin-type processing-associated H-X9-DG protein